MTDRGMHRIGGRYLYGAVLAWAGVAAGAFAQSLPQVARERFPDDDAVILRQEQNWTLGPDGAMVFEEHRWVKLLTDRSWRRWADPRIDFLEGQEQVELITARTHLPDGSAIDIPDYSTVYVSPDGVSQWPAFAAWRQVIYIFSGVQNEATLELHYRRTSQPGTRRWLEADLRVGDEDPVMEWVVNVSVPAGMTLRHRVDRIDDDHVAFTKESGGGQDTYRWTLKDIPSEPDEANCPPWRQRCGRLRFTNCDSSRRWASDLLEAIEQAAQAAEPVEQFARESSKEALEDADRIRAVSEKIRDTVNTVDDWQSWVGRQVRPAAVVFDACYGSTLEVASLTLAALRSLGFDASPRLAVDGRYYDDDAPTDADLSAVVVEVATPEETILVDPAHGVINPNGAWRHRDLLQVAEGKLARTAVATTNAPASGVRVRGNLKLDKAAEKMTGDVTVELTGVFVNPEALRTEDKQRSRVESLAADIMPDLKVVDFSVSHLSDRRFVVQASLESKEPPAKVYDRRTLTLAADSPVLAQARLPLSRSARRTPVQLSDRMGGDLQLRLELPDNWKAVVLPQGMPAVAGDWGRMEQQVTATERGITIERRVRFDVDTLEPDAFAKIREAARILRSDACRVLLIERAE